MCGASGSVISRARAIQQWDAERYIYWKMLREEQWRCWGTHALVLCDVTPTLYIVYYCAVAIILNAKSNAWALHPRQYSACRLYNVYIYVLHRENAPTQYHQLYIEDTFLLQLIIVIVIDLESFTWNIIILL